MSMVDTARSDSENKADYYKPIDIFVRCTAQDAGQPEFDDLKVIFVKAQENVSLELDRVWRTLWTVTQNDRLMIPVPVKSVRVVVASESHGDLGYVQKDLSEWLTDSAHSEKCELCSLSCVQRRSITIFLSIDLFWDLEPTGENAFALSIAVRIYNPASKQIESEHPQGGLDSDLLALLAFGKWLPDDHPEKGGHLFAVGSKLRRRFAISQDKADIDISIDAYECALEVVPINDNRIINILNGAGAAHADRFLRFGDTVDINKAINRMKILLGLHPDGHANLPAIWDSLGSLFLVRFEHVGDIEDLTQSMQLLKQSVDLTPEDHTALPRRLNNLGNLFMSRFERSGDLHDITQSLQLQQQAVDLTPEGQADLPSWLNNLGGSFLRYFEQTEDLPNIEKSIQLIQRAVDLTPEGHADLPSWLNNLGTSFSCRFESTGDLHDIGQSIHFQQQAVNLTPEGHVALPLLLNSLGISFVLRFDLTRDLHDIAQSIQLQQRAVDLTPEGHVKLPAWLSSLGNTFSRRFYETRDLHDISQSIELQQQAVNLSPEGHADLPVWLNNLGTSFSRRFDQTRDLDDIAHSILLKQRAVDLTPKGHPSLPLELNNLGMSFSRRFEQNRDLHDISQTIQLMQQAVELTPEGHIHLPIFLNNLGDAFNAKFDVTKVSEDFTNAHSTYRACARSISGPLAVCLASARRWAEMSSQIAESELQEAYDRVINLMSLIAGMENTSRRRHELLTELSAIPTTAAAAALSVYQPSKALEWLEAGRCIVWGQINELRSPVDELCERHPELANKFTMLSKQLDRLGAREDFRHAALNLPMNTQISLETEAHNHLMLTREREQLLMTIRETPGFNSFLRRKKCAELMAAVPYRGVFVIINSDKSKNRCDAIILVAGQEEPTHIPLEQFSCERARTLADGLRYRLAPHEFRSCYPEEDASEPRKIGRYKGPSPGDDVKGMLRALWDDLVDPVLQSLGFKNEREDTDLPRIWWCPTGPFAFLPIHAAGIYGTDGKSSSTCLADYAVSSYIPTLSILDKLRSRSSDGSIDGTGVLLVSQPNTPGQSSIPNTKAEVVKTREELEKRGIRTAWYNGEDATVASVSESMRFFSSVHLACHASQNITNPLESAIFLHDGALELSEIMKMDLPKADLAFLSACQTSVGARNLPEEAVHLAAGMLTAGYRSVVATMWSISDYHAPEVAETFYKCLMNDETKEGVVGLDITGSAQALHIAVQALRRKLGDSTEDLLKWIPYVHYGI
ncbi:hypothetical protein CVT26_007177 [Gymnopilus dilepis]|uniref:CHAT domain-containing protein n=1 Tax=Gymnopilus dilepis TaxID=231916 RepID=A0A409W6J2_9AGAR|nr:hypothetical protein CVT26_007177 [Gymnopilus dilepis]